MLYTGAETYTQTAELGRHENRALGVPEHDQPPTGRMPNAVQRALLHRINISHPTH